MAADAAKDVVPDECLRSSNRRDQERAAEETHAERVHCLAHDVVDKLDVSRLLFT